MEVAPWYAHIANYLVTGEVPSEWKAYDKKHFFAKGDPQSLPRKRMWRSLCFSEDNYAGIAIGFLLAITFQRCPHHV